MYVANIHLLVFLSTISFSSAHSATVLKYEEGPQTWNKALETCVHRYNGTLWDIDHVDKDLSDSLIPYLKENNIIWTGMYTMLTSWISDEGCFDADESSFKRVITGENIYRVGDCMMECDKVSLGYFAVKGRNCLCAERLPNSKVMPDRCSEPCDSCIDLSYFRVYKHSLIVVIVEEVAEGGGQVRVATAAPTFVLLAALVAAAKSTNDNTMDSRCATASCKGADPVIYRAQSCDRTFPAVCSNGQNVSEILSRSKAEEACIKSDSFLVGAIGDDLCSAFNTSGEGQQYWVGLYKYEVGPYTTQKEVDPDSLYECQTGVVHDSSLHTNMENCEIGLHPYICQFEPNDHLSKTLCKDPSSAEMEFIHDDDGTVTNITLSQLCGRLAKLASSGQAPGSDLYQSGLIGIIVCAGLIASWCCIVVVICSRKGRKRRKGTTSKTPEYVEEEMKFIPSYRIDKRGSAQLELQG